MPAQKKLLIAVVALVAVFLIGTTGYHVIEEGVGLGDAAYMTIISISTVGYGHVWELSPTGRIWTAAILVFGLLIVTVALASLQAMIVGGELRGILGRRKLQNQISKLSGHYVLCGYGRMGKLIGDQLARRGKKVVVVERDTARTVLAEETATPYVLGDATHEKTLTAAGIERAGGLVAALGTDAENVFVTLTAAGMQKQLQIIARAEYFDSEPKLRRAGATHVVCPHAIGATRIANLLARPAIAHLVDITTAGSEWEIDEVPVAPESAMVGQSLRDLNLRDRCNAMVVAIRGADGKTRVNPSAKQTVGAGDVLVVIGPAGVASELRAAQSGAAAGA
jgi:voltage-gated potassium channel